MKRESVSVEDGSLQQEQGQIRSGSPGDLAIVFADAALDGRKRRGRLLAVAGQHVEGHLSIENTLRQLLKREQIHGLLVQFVHALLAVFGRGLKHGGRGSNHLAGLLHAQQQESQHDGGRMRRHHRAGLQLWNQGLSQLALDPRRAHYGVGIVLQSVGEVHDVGAGVAGNLPGLAGGFGIGGKEGEVDIAEFFRAHLLDESDLVTQGLEFAQGLVVVQ